MNEEFEAIKAFYISFIKKPEFSFTTRERAQKILRGGSFYNLKILEILITKNRTE